METAAVPEWHNMYEEGKRQVMVYRFDLTETPDVEIISLPKEQWKGTAIPLTTRNDSYYDVEISPPDHDGCTVSLVRKAAEKEIVHSPEEYDFPDSLYQDHWENTEAYGVVSDAGELPACIEVCPEEWSNRLMVTELWVSEALRGKGVGKRLMSKRWISLPHTLSSRKGVRPCRQSSMLPRWKPSTPKTRTFKPRTPAPYEAVHARYKERGSVFYD